MGFARFTTSIIVVLLSAFIYSRWPTLQLFYTNHPSRLLNVNTVGEYEIKFRDTVRNCEDIYLNEEQGWALLSCDPGRDEWNTVMGVFVNPSTPPETGIYLYKYGQDSDAVPLKVQLEAPENHGETFHPLGIEYHEPSQTLFVINHSPEGPNVEWYTLDAAQAVAKYEGSVHNSTSLPAPNSLAAISKDELFATNDHFFPAKYNSLLAKLETYAGFPGGTVAYIKRNQDGSTLIKTLARIPFANGIALLNSSALAVASSNTADVRIFTITWASDGTPELSQIKSIAVPFAPDNLSIDGKGRLLITGHPHAPSLEDVARKNGFCEGAERAAGEDCSLSKLSWVAEWTEETGLTTLFAGSEFGTSTTAVRDWQAGVGFVVGLYERGLLAWKL
ncbi:hypothetical protein CERZMDRAFT_119897 [Cercospora zeae-maydis SCOH1-5]|uniref:Phytase-like domain-containing protein n=1 Tax=Cercospora zeae-maydis SCOH1-5 TaxID=717836 RepID=A0A6A6FSB7_9PEZI|nr:hypothetical protein CERZMDRAFT_119897 [Cercospora zeae-maydis SCOH1-5]